MTAPASDAQGWRPIESAPKDGTTVLGYGPHVSRGWYIETVHTWNGKWTIEWMEDYGSPTHWMPLPPPPQVTP